MPSRHRPKAPPPAPLSDVERFARAVRESEEAKRQAKQVEKERKEDAERKKAAAIERAADLERARHAHQHAVDLVKEAQRTGKGATAADAAWREAKARLIELETGELPPWARSSRPTGDEQPSPDDD